MSKSFLRSNIITLLAHISAWAAFLLIPFFVTDYHALPTPPIADEDVPIKGKILVIGLVVSVFYINYLMLVPRVLNRFGARYYFGAVLLLGFIFASILYLVVNNLGTMPLPIPPLVFVFPFTIILTLSLALGLLKDRNRIEQERKERENETLKSELSFLRSQISPHFLFNIMNNVVALSRVKPEKVEPTLIQLSHLMRYMLYNTDEKKVSISKEIEYLESYIDLQKLRFGDSVEVVFHKNTEGGGLHQIEPMLLIPFVENAFKHGTGMIEKPKIDINLSIANNQLIFIVLNKYDPLNVEIKDENSGIGLKNVSRRLDLLYGENQKLSVNTDGTSRDTREGGIFQVKLMILLAL
jgi:two-component system, LytTR family, sensor kinase